MNKHDLTFMKHFAQLLAGLVVLAILLILGAMYVHGKSAARGEPRDHRRDPSTHRQCRRRLLRRNRQGCSRSRQDRRSRSQQGRSSLWRHTGRFATIYNNLCGACHSARCGRRTEAGKGRLGGAYGSGHRHAGQACDRRFHRQRRRDAGAWRQPLDQR
jgi:hypothetical protein